MNGDKSKDKCANCGKPTGFPRSLCYNCEKPLCRNCGGRGNASAYFLGDAFMGKNKELLCKKCFNLAN